MLAKNKILVIGNDPELLGLIQEELSDEYDVVSTQETGSGLRDEVHQECPEFIILDIMMPTLDGIEICLHMRQWTQTPILMCTAWETEDNKVRGLNLCSDTYLTQPFGTQELKNRIEQTLKRNAAVAAAAASDPLANIRTSMS